MEREYSNKDELISRYAKALGHPARVLIVGFLASQRECYFGELHDVLPLSKATVSQHLSELKDAGLIQGVFEPPKVRYCINREHWMVAKALFAELFDELKSDGCCK